MHVTVLFFFLIFINKAECLLDSQGGGGAGPRGKSCSFM